MRTLKTIAISFVLLLLLSSCKREVYSSYAYSTGGSTMITTTGQADSVSENEAYEILDDYMRSKSMFEYAEFLNSGKEEEQAQAKNDEEAKNLFLAKVNAFKEEEIVNKFKEKGYVTVSVEDLSYRVVRQDGEEIARQNLSFSY